MRASSLLCAAVAILLTATLAFAFVPSPKVTPGPGELPPAKESQVSEPPTPVHVDQAGDTIASALPILSIPFSDSGTTAGYVDNYGPNCGLAGGAPDVVYSISPTIGGDVAIALCGSAYDTEVYVYADVAGNIIGCNDDSCGLQSQLIVPMLTGHTYYIVVDGYSNASGPYQIGVTCWCGCSVHCPTGGLPEGEPVCGDSYRDSYNGGCGSDPIVFSALQCTPTGTQTVCGTYGGFYFSGLSYRDTDWYEIVIPPGPDATITWEVRGESDTLIGILDGRSGCAVTSFYDYAYGARCMDLSATGTLGPGTWWLWVGTLYFGAAAGPCGQDYVATLSGFQCLPVAVEPTTWGAIKSLYR